MYFTCMPVRKTKFKISEHYQVVNRGFDRKKIFCDDEDYWKFKNLVSRYSKRVGVVVYALVVNHFHFLLEQTEVGGLEYFFKVVQREYSRYFNRKYRCKGTLFQGRFWAEEIEDEDHYYNVMAYILRNPGKHKMVNLGRDGWSGAKLQEPEG